MSAPNQEGTERSVTARIATSGGIALAAVQGMPLQPPHSSATASQGAPGMSTPLPSQSQSSSTWSGDMSAGDDSGTPSNPSVLAGYSECLGTCVAASSCVSVPPVSSVSPVSPVSGGQASEADKERLLRQFGARNACQAPGEAGKRRLKLARDLAMIEKAKGGLLTMAHLRTASLAWYSASQPFLDSHATPDNCLASLVARLRKVRVPTGEGVLEKATAKVAALSIWELPLLDADPDAPETWRRLAALHRELSAASGGTKYFLSYRDAGRAIGIRPQEVHDITPVLERLGVIQIVDKGKAGPNSGKAAEFLYMLAESDEDCIF